MSHTFPIFPAPMGEWLVEAYMWITLPLTALFFAMAALPLTRALTLRFLSFLCRASSSTVWYLLALFTVGFAWWASDYNAAFAVESLLILSLVFRVPPSLVRWIFDGTTPPSHLRGRQNDFRKKTRA